MRLAILFYVGHLLFLGWIASSEIFLGLAILAAMIAAYRGEIEVRPHPLYFPLLLYAVASTISTALHPNPWHTRPELGEWFTFASFPLALSLQRSWNRMARVTIRTLLALAIFQSSVGLYQYFVLHYSRLELSRRITGTLSHVMTFSGILVALSIFFLTISIRTRSVPAIVAAISTTTALVFTFTRGAWIGWLAAILFLLLRRHWRLAFYALPVLILAITFSPMALFSRLASTFDTTQSSNLDRIRMVQAGVEIIRDFPLFGVGPSNVKEVYPLYRKPDAPRFRVPHLHNNPVQIWAERGILALVAYLLILVIVAWECLRVPPGRRVARTFADAGLGVALGLAVAGLFEFNFGDTEVLFILLSLLALILAVIERLTPETAETDDVANGSPRQLVENRSRTR